MSSVRWDELKRSMLRATKTNWKLFRQSKLGMVGLGIIIFFLILAIFAPLIPFTYSPNYLAPAGDLFEIDNYTVSIPTQDHWHAPVSIKTPIRRGFNAAIGGILIYSSNGKAYFYPRDMADQSLLRLKNPVFKSIPSGMNDMLYLKYNNKIIGLTNDSLYFYGVRYWYNTSSSSEEIVTDSLLDNPLKVTFPYSIKYYSNIWDENLTGSSGLVAIALASERNVSLFVWSYSSMFGGVSSITHFKYTFPMNATVVAAPQIRMDFANEHTWVIVPTDKYIVEYDLQWNKNNNTGQVEGISGKTIGWYHSLTRNGKTYELNGANSIGLIYARAYMMTQVDPSLDIMVALCKDNYAFGLYSNNGTEAWNTTITLNPQDARIHTMEVKGMFGTVREFMMLYGTTNVGSFIAKLDPKTGVVMNSTAGSETAYMILRGTINYVSEYDGGSRSYYVSTEEGAIYKVKELFYTNLTGGARSEGLNMSFTVIGGSATPAVYLGSTYTSHGLTGTYIGVVTKQNTIYLQASGGTRIPTVVIPPFGHGRASGNFYLFGTDYEGHDIWTWLVYGARTSLLVGLTAAVISVIAGTFIGIISGFYGGWIDIVIMRTVDIVLTLPGIVIMLLLAAVMGPNIWNIVLIISVLGWAGIARVIRAVTLSLKNRPFMDAARVAGASNARMITVHIFPNVLPLTFLYMTFGVAGAILSEAALAFLGLGDPNSISWGMMLQYLRMYAQQTNPNAWGWLIMPGVFITLISLAFYLVGRAFDEIVNPRLRKR